MVKIIIKKILLSIFSILLTLIIFEIILHIYYPNNYDYHIEMWRYASEMKQISDIPNLGHEHIPNKSNTFYGAEINTNSLGLRANKEYILPKPEGSIRILVLGDSITLGWGVDYVNTYTKVLESMLNKGSTVEYEVINTGVGNYNSINELAALKKYHKLAPDIIILGFYINDIEEVNYPSKVGYFLKRKSYLSAVLISKLINYKNKGQTNYKNYYLNLYDDQKRKNILKDSINEMITFANNRSIPFIFVNIPEFHQFKDYPFSEINDFLVNEIVENTNITYIDLLPVFQNLSKDAKEYWVSPEDHHPNAQLHRIIAKSIYDNIHEQAN